MNFPQIPDWVGAILGFISISLWVYYYFKNKKQKVEVDPEEIEYSTALGLGSITFIILSMAIIAIIFGQNTEGAHQAINNMKWIGFILLIIGYSILGYKFKKKRKRLAAQSGIENQDSN